MLTYDEPDELHRWVSYPDWWVPGWINWLESVGGSARRLSLR
jgi:hypothetical protein